MERVEKAGWKKKPEKKKRERERAFWSAKTPTVVLLTKRLLDKKCGIKEVCLLRTKSVPGTACSAGASKVVFCSLAPRLKICALKLAFDSMHPWLRHSTCFTSLGAYARAIHNKDNVAAIIAASLCKFSKGSKLIFLKDYYCQCRSGKPHQFTLA